MVVDDTIQILQTMKTELLEHKSPDKIIAALAKEILDFLHCDQVCVKYIEEDGLNLSYSTDSTEVNHLYSLTSDGIKFKECVIPLPIYLKDLAEAPFPRALVNYEESLHTSSLGIVPITKEGTTVGWIECRYLIDSHQWKREETFVLQQIAEFCPLAIDNTKTADLPKTEAKDFYDVFDAMYQNKKIITIKTDENWRIVDIVGDAEAVFGAPKLTLLNDENVWRHFVTSKSVHAFRHLIKTMSDSPECFSTELGIRNQKLQQVKYMLVNACPLKDGAGWELCAIDVTDKALMQERLVSENRALNALYDVSIAVQERNIEKLANNFLSIVTNITKADAAYFVSYKSALDSFELVSSVGLDSDAVAEIVETINQNSVLDYIYNKGEILVLNNISSHKEDGLIELKRHDFLSLLCTPFILGEANDLLGAVVVLSKEDAHFKQSDVKFLRAASQQVAAALNYLVYFESERKQKASMTTLYRLSHELAANSSGKILNKAAKIIADTLPCKKIWFGLIDDVESFVVGQGGYGIRAPLIKVSVQLGNDNHVFTEVLKTKQPLFLNAESENAALERIFRKLRIKDAIVLPLQASGHPIGVACVEIACDVESFKTNDLPSLINMCAEVANVIFARKLESKVQEGQKLQSAGLLASGMAHNFNNMLQAIIGVASLIQLQSPNNSAVYDAAVTIINSSKRGAELIKQMMLLTEQVSADKKAISINNLIKSSFYSYEAILGNRVDLEMQLSENLPLVNANYDQISEALEHLVKNAKEALAGQISPTLRIFTSVVSFNNGELSANLPSGKYVCISVIDNGCGMSDEVVARCLDPFFTTKNVDSKTGVGVSSAGLGLSMTYAVMRQHGGVVNVRSNVGGGTTINLYLPALKESEKSLPIEPNIAVMRSLSAKALFVESQGELLLNMGDKLKSLGLQPFLFPDYEDIADKLREDPTIKVLVVDIDHIGGRVETVLKRIHSRFPNLLMFGFTYEPEKWNGVLRYLADMYVFDKPVGTWAIESIETCCKRLQIPLKLEDQIILSNGSAKRRNTLSRTMSASEIAAFRERLKKDFSLN